MSWTVWTDNLLTCCFTALLVLVGYLYVFRWLVVVVFLYVYFVNYLSYQFYRLSLFSSLLLGESLYLYSLSNFSVFCYRSFYLFFLVVAMANLLILVFLLFSFSPLSYLEALPVFLYLCFSIWSPGRSLSLVFLVFLFSIFLHSFKSKLYQSFYISAFPYTRLVSLQSLYS